MAGIAALVVTSLLCTANLSGAQILAVLRGRVLDASGAVVPDAIVRVRGESIGLDISVRTDAEGRYYVPDVPSGTFIVTVEAAGFRTERIAAFTVDAGRTLVRDFNLSIGDVAAMVLVRAEVPLVDRAWRGRTFFFASYQGLRQRQGIDLNSLVPSDQQVDTSYTWSKSLDTNSLNSSGFAVQDGYDIPGQYGPSDFDARHRFVLSAAYALPFSQNAVTRGWQIAAVVQSQSGNPVNIVTSNGSLNGVANSVRPDVTGPIQIVGSVDQWFDPIVFVAVNGFGTLGRNAVTGPAFHNTDLQLAARVSF